MTREAGAAGADANSVVAPAPPLGRVARSQAALAFAFAGRLAVALAVTALLGRLLREEDFGFFSYIGTIFALAAIVLDLGSEAMAVREITRDPAREVPVLEGLIAWRTAFGLVLGGFVLASALSEADGGRRGVLLGVALCLGATGPGAMNVVFQLRQAQVAPAIAGFLNQLLVVAGILVLRARSAPGVAYAWLIVVRELLSLVLVWALARRHLGTRLRLGFRHRGLRRFVAMAAIHGLAVASHGVYFHVDIFLVRALRGEIELGAYAAAFRPINTLLTLPGLFMLPLLPSFSAAALGAPTRLAELLHRYGRLLVVLGVTGAAFAIVLAEDVVRLLYGGRYLDGPLEAVSALRWMGLAFLAVAVAAPLVSTVLAAGGERALLRIGALGVVVNVAGNLALLPFLDFEAAAAMTAGTEAVVATALAAAAARRTELRLRALLSPLVVAPLLGALALALLPGLPPLLRLGLGAGLAMGIAIVAFRRERVHDA